MVNLRKRAAVKAPQKRTSNRRGEESSVKGNKKYKEINIDSEGEEDIEISEVEEEASELISENVSDTLNELPTTSSDSDSSDILIDSDDDGGSEDDKEIRRIIEKTEAETKNIPLTARQRAALEGAASFPQQALKTPSIPANNNSVTDEQALKNSEKSRRRKLQRDLKVEETKRATIDRLLQKQKKTPSLAAASTAAATLIDQIKEEERKKLDQVGPPTGIIRFIDRQTASFLQFPDDSTFKTAFDPPKLTHSTARGSCQVCTKNESKYTHPVNGKVFCSLSCYKLIE